MYKVLQGTMNLTLSVQQLTLNCGPRQRELAPPSVVPSLDSQNRHLIIQLTCDSQIHCPSQPLGQVPYLKANPLHLWPEKEDNAAT